jgi:hypothetical protein
MYLLVIYNNSYVCVQINLADDEHMIRVSGTTDGTYVTSLTFSLTRLRNMDHMGQSQERA